MQKIISGAGMVITALVLASAALSQSSAPALVILDVEPAQPDTSELNVLFDHPLPFGGQGVEGNTISQVIEGTPLFSPIEGLPDAAWKDKSCSGCHQWDREALCTQGGFYTLANGAEALSKQHPMGGGFKQTLRNWAAQGCN